MENNALNVEFLFCTYCFLEDILRDFRRKIKLECFVALSFISFLGSFKLSEFEVRESLAACFSKRCL